MTNKPISEVIAEIQRLLSSIEKYQRQGKIGEWVEEYRIATCPAELRRVFDHIAALEQQLAAERARVVKAPKKVNVKMGGDKSTKSMFSGMNMMHDDFMKALSEAGIPTEGE